MSEMNENTGSKKDLSYFGELLSALKDGELSDDQLGEVLEGVKKYPELQKYWLTIQNSSSILSGDKDIDLPTSTSVTRAINFTASVSSKLVRVDQNSSAESAYVNGDTGTDSNKVVGINTIKSTTVVDNHLGFRGFAIAASVMFLVTFGWLGSQAELRQTLTQNAVAWFNPSFNLNTNPNTSTVANDEQLALENRRLESVHDRIIPQHSVLVSAGQKQPQFESTQQGKHNSNQRALHLSKSRMQNYIRLHAEHASLNTNYGVMPFARMNKVIPESQF